MHSLVQTPFPPATHEAWNVWFVYARSLVTCRQRRAAVALLFARNNCSLTTEPPSNLVTEPVTLSARFPACSCRRSVLTKSRAASPAPRESCGANPAACARATPSAPARGRSGRRGFELRQEGRLPARNAALVRQREPVSASSTDSSRRHRPRRSPQRCRLQSALL